MEQWGSVEHKLNIYRARTKIRLPGALRISSVQCGGCPFADALAEGFLTVPQPGPQAL